MVCHLWRQAQREQRYRQALRALRELRDPRALRELRDPRPTLQIGITEDMVRGLLKRGYLGPDECDDLKALRQAVTLFIWDTIRKTPKPKRPDGQGPTVSAYAGDEAIDD
jgi:hypothetical protein